MSISMIFFLDAYTLGTLNLVHGNEFTNFAQIICHLNKHAAAFMILVQETELHSNVLLYSKS